jgi:hypothetical protein
MNPHPARVIPTIQALPIGDDRRHLSSIRVAEIV